jgi:Ca2+-binding RTX toxin-like protein
MRIRVVLVLAVLAMAFLPAATGSAAVMCFGLAATKVGTAGADTINGTAGDDVIVGLGGNDTINGLGGNDRICGNDGNDVIRPGAGNDRVRGGGGWDIILGGDGADTLQGGAGADVVYGEGGNDRLFGQAGADNLDGGPGTDTVTGGLGTDTCYGETKVSCELPPPPLPWIITAQGVGPISVGAPRTTVSLLTGMTWTWEEPGAEGCLVGTTPVIDVVLQSDDGVVIDHITVYDPAAAATTLGIGVGDTRAALNGAYGSHVVQVTEDYFYYGVAVWVDLDNDGEADMIAVIDGPGTTEPITDIRLPAILTEGGCL